MAVSAVEVADTTGLLHAGVVRSSEGDSPSAVGRTVHSKQEEVNGPWSRGGRFFHPATEETHRIGRRLLYVALSSMILLGVAVALLSTAEAPNRWKSSGRQFLQEDASPWVPVNSSHGACRSNGKFSYEVHEMIGSLPACKALCARNAECKSIEYGEKLDVHYTRCEIWKVVADFIAPMDGYTCLRYDRPASEPLTRNNTVGKEDPTWELVQGGVGRACSADPSLEALHLGKHAKSMRLSKPVESLDICKKLCKSQFVCTGVEYNAGGGQCVLWEIPIATSVPDVNATCVRYAGQRWSWDAVDGGSRRACVGSQISANVKIGAATLEICKSLCEQDARCAGVEYSSDGRCELWQVPISKSVPADNFTCIRRTFADSETPTHLAVCAWSGENCTRSRCCADPMKKCFELNAQFATCKDPDSCVPGPEARNPAVNWTCNVLGGSVTDNPPVLPAPQGQDVGVTLFCFTVVTPGTFEEGIVSTQRQQRLSIFACERSGVYWGYNVEIVQKGQWQSFRNTEVFLKVWEDMRKDKKYRSCDWTVKLDPDAVFFPDRLRVRLTDMRPPVDAAIYIKNQPTGDAVSQFGLLGPIEVFSRQAVDEYFTRQKTCRRPYRLKSGEDSYMKTCMDAIGVSHMDDPGMLLNSYTLDSCNSSKLPAAIHAFKSTEQWLACWNRAKAVRVR